MPDILQQIAQSCTFQGDATASEIAHAIHEIHGIDKHSEKQQRLGCWAMGLGFLSLFPVTPILVSNGMASLGGITGIAGIAVLIVGVVKQYKYGRTDFEDRRYRLLESLTRLLQVDMAPEAQMSISLNLLPQNHKSKFQSKGTAGLWSVDHFLDHWLQISGRFLDGTYFSISMTEKHQARSRRARTSRGKTKFKQKTKNASVVVVALKTKADRYLPIEKLGENVQGALQLPYGSFVKSLNAEGNQIQLTVTTKTAWGVAVPGGEKVLFDGVQLVASMFLSLYQILNLSREVVKASDK